MRADPPARGRVALHAVTLLVTGYATLQPLPRGAPVLKHPERLRVVVRAVEPPPRRQATRLMARTAEDFGVVARLALLIATVRLRCVAHDEVGGVKASARLARVTVATEALHVATLAREAPGRRRTRVRALEARRVYAHDGPYRVRNARGSARCLSHEHRHRLRRGYAAYTAHSVHPAHARNSARRDE